VQVLTNAVRICPVTGRADGFAVFVLLAMVESASLLLHRVERVSQYRSHDTPMIGGLRLTVLVR
jgi:hypothetical protein